MPPKNTDADKALAWAKTTLDNVVREMTDQGVVDSPLLESRLAWTIPFEVVLGQLRDQGHQVEFLWVIGGSVPIDSIHSNIATTARDAARHFAMKWQLEASRLEEAAEREQRSAGPEPELRAQAGAFVAHAEYLYAVADDDRFWS